MLTCMVGPGTDKISVSYYPASWEVVEKYGHNSVALLLDLIRGKFCHFNSFSTIFRAT
jgi:hypothetical protein